MGRVNFLLTRFFYYNFSPPVFWVGKLEPIWEIGWARTTSQNIRCIITFSDADPFKVDFASPPLFQNQYKSCLPANNYKIIKFNLKYFDHF